MRIFGNFFKKLYAKTLVALSYANRVVVQYSDMVIVIF